MATLVLGAIGTAIGGPIGGALGSVLGRSLDAQLIGGPRREGPRLKDLAVSLSSYGQPIPALYGSLRVPGTVIWATDLKERRDTAGGGKGQPRTTSYSYSVSLAVVLASRPIDALGRIWADGNLLRGRAGDLKTAGRLRLYRGHGDQQPDPLLAAALGAQCPAHRGCAYVVFEDLALEDFGNRIPALSFEVFAGDARELVAHVAQEAGVASQGAAFPELAGYIDEGGGAAQLLAQIDRLLPLSAVPVAGGIAIEHPAPPAAIPTLPPPSAWDEGEFGREGGTALARRTDHAQAPAALRHYDSTRDYQPGLQRAPGPASGGETLEFPGVFTPVAARALLDAAVRRAQEGNETLAWRTATLDPAIGPGSVVRAPGHAGLWHVAAWEWREGGIELELHRHVATGPHAATADGGSAWSPPDRTAVATLLRAFELPWDGHGSGETRQRFAAIGAPTGRWPGAALYLESGATLTPLAQSGPVRALGGKLIAPLAADPGLRFAPDAALRVALDDAEGTFEPAGGDALARGANRLLVGDEILQFARAEAEGGGLWRLSGLLRGRGGTEGEAMAGHAINTPVTLLDDRLIPLPAELALGPGDRLAAIGLADAEPVFAALECPGRSRRPLSPVHPRLIREAAGAVRLQWTRRARGGWAWLDEVEQPLVEQTEAYEVGLGPVPAPLRRWDVTAPALVIPAREWTELAARHPGAMLWVRQTGSFARSPPLLLATLPPRS